MQLSPHLGVKPGMGPANNPRSLPLPWASPTPNHPPIPISGLARPYMCMNSFTRPLVMYNCQEYISCVFFILLGSCYKISYLYFSKRSLDQNHLTFFAVYKDLYYTLLLWNLEPLSTYISQKRTINQIKTLNCNIRHLFYFFYICNPNKHFNIVYLMRTSEYYIYEIRQHTNPQTQVCLFSHFSYYFKIVEFPRVQWQEM